MGESRVANLVIVGVPKAATSSLFAYLAQHPEICGSDEKELGYFNHYSPWRAAGPVPPIEEYARHWAHCTDERYLMEATPTYCYGGKEVVTAVREVLGRPRIILILRNPADRLWSAYTFQRSVGNNPEIGSFDQYLDIVERRWHDGTGLVPRSGLHGLEIGFYSNYVGDWLDEYGEDMRVVFQEDLRDEPHRLLEELCRWLGIDTDVVPTFEVDARNVTRHPRSPRLAHTARRLKQRTGHLLPTSAYRRMRNAYFRLNSGQLSERFEPELRRRVEEIYRQSNRETAQILAAHGYEDQPAWLRVGSAV